MTCGNRSSAAVFAVIVVTAALAARTAGQTTDGVPGCETEKAKQLQFLEGAWDVESRFRTSSEPEKWELTEAVSVIEPVFPGCLWREEMTGIRARGPLSVIGLFSYTNISDRLQHSWAHSLHGALSHYEGGFVGDELVFEARFTLRGREFISRKVFRKTPNGFDVRSERSADGGKTWDAGWYLSYRRQKPADPR